MVFPFGGTVEVFYISARIRIGLYILCMRMVVYPTCARPRSPEDGELCISFFFLHRLSLPLFPPIHDTPNWQITWSWVFFPDREVDGPPSMFRPGWVWQQGRPPQTSIKQTEDRNLDPRPSKLLFG